MNALEWHYPWWLLLGLTPFILHGIRYLLRKRLLQRYASPHLLPWLVLGQPHDWRMRLVSRTSLWALVWLLLALAAAGPRVPDPLQQDGIRETVDIAVLLDASRSMRVQDQRPDRFRRARIELHELMGRLRGDRLALIPYAGSAHVLVPPTWDVQVFSHYLNRLSPSLLPVHGSRADRALTLARKLLSSSRNDRARAVLLLTDGDFDIATRQAIEEEVRRLRQAGIRLFVLGLGSETGGGILLDNGQWLGLDGRPVISRLQADWLKRLANIGGGRFARSVRDDGDWRLLYDNGIARLASYRISKTQRQRIRWRELYVWFLAPALLLLGVLLFGGLHRHATPVALLVLLLSPALLPDAQAAGHAAIERQAWQAWQRGDYRRAAALYRQVPGYRGSFGRGASHYRRADYAAAARHFASAVIDAGNDQERAAALFNLGNSWFRLGRYRAAEESYRDSLRYRPGDPATRHNLAFTRALIREIERQQRMARLLRKGRGGHGPRLGMGNGGLGRYGSEESDENRKRLAARYRIPPDQLARLIARGLRFARVVGRRQAGRGMTDPNDPLGLESVRARMRQIEEKTGLLIKTLLELEAGYNAPLEQPETMPGVRPW